MPTEEKKTTTKTAAKKTATKKPAAKKPAAKKPAAKKTATKKTTTKKATTKKTAPKKPAAKKPAASKTVASSKQQGFTVKQNPNQSDNLLDLLSATPANPTKTEKPTKKTTKPATTKKATVKKPQRTPHKERKFTKEEKVLYKKLESSFNYIANLTMVIEERTLDKENVPDLTLGELHVLEVFNQEAAIPMTKAANQLKITVGSLTTCVNRLVKKEYLLRERDAVDHRVIKVSTTQKAKKVLKEHDKFHQEILLGVLDGVTIRDATKVMAQFERTLENYINPKEKNYDKPIDTKKKKNL